MPECHAPLFSTNDIITHAQYITMTSVSHEETTVPRSDVPLTRASFIADDHVKTAITHLETIWRIDDAGCVEVPMPPSVKETGVLPIGYCVGTSSFYVSNALN